MVGTDYYALFAEKSMLMLEKYPILNANVKFMHHDFLLDKFENPFDIATFGFEVSFDLLRQQ